MTCQTGFCIEGSQPHCIDGHLNWGANDQQMSCAVQEVSTCDYPPNGGCDPLTDCIDTGTGLFNLKVVTCSQCPAGYYGTGRTGCNDVNECNQRVNGGCDSHTVCQNTDGGYHCNYPGCTTPDCRNTCPVGFNGDPFRLQGCCADGDGTYQPVGEKGATCNKDIRKPLLPGSKGMAAVVVILLVLFFGVLPTGIFCHLCSKKQYKDGGNSFEKIDVGSIGTGPSIYDSTWAR
jgi:hypothetical protein